VKRKRRLSDYLSEKELLWVPLVFDPLGARIAETSGFKVLYLGGAALGYLKCVTEANLGLSELIQTGLDIRSVTKAPLILDGAGGFGEMANFQPHVSLADSGGPSGILNSIHETMDLNTLLRIEKQTVEP
jgi:2-methylisocitrate lyase-like PEP mutase family enzyme